MSRDATTPWEESYKMTTAAATDGFPVMDLRPFGQARNLLDLGKHLAEVGHYADAALALRRRLRLAPDDLEARRLLGVSLLRSGEPAAAATALEALGRHQGADAALCLELGSALMADDPQRARGWLLAAVRSAPDNVTARIRLGEVDAVLAGVPRPAGRHRRPSLRAMLHRARAAR